MQICEIEGCETQSKTLGMCHKHYMRAYMRKRRRGTAEDQARKNARGLCSYIDCDRPHAAHGLCDLHYRRQRASMLKVERLCARCEQAMPKGRKSYCSDECARAAKRAIHIRNRYGVTEEWYEATLAKQGGGCAICGVVESAHGKPRLSIDHDHATGVARGLLCQQCNVGLANFDEDARRLQRAATYLEAVA